AAPAMISREDDAAARPAQPGAGIAMSNVFTTAALPAHHRELLVVKMREQSLSSDAPASISAVHEMGASSFSNGLGALAFYERAGKIKRVVPVRRDSERVTQRPGISAVSALTYAADAPGAQSESSPEKSEAPQGISFIELQRGQDPQQLQTAL